MMASDSVNTRVISHPLLTQGRHLTTGPVGNIDFHVDVPKQAVGTKVAIVTHPQPLLGGNAQHKIPHFLAKALTEHGWTAIRPNFRGVGQSDGVHDSGEGETADVLHLIQGLGLSAPGKTLALVGFSFGAYVLAKVAAELQQASASPAKICLAGMPYGSVEGGRSYDTPRGFSNALVIHGECDERVPLSAILEWARPAGQVVSVIPGTDHFFSGRLPILRDHILNFLA